MKEGWKETTLGDLFVIERGGSPRPIQAFLTNSVDGINWIKIGDTKNSTKYITETKEKIIPEGVRRSRMVYEGDFLLSNSMSFGRPYIMKTSGCIHDGWLVLREQTNLTDKDFFYYLLGSDLIFKQFDDLAAGSTVRNLNIGLVSKVVVPLPPLDEQQRIVKKLDAAFAAIDQAIVNTEKNLENAEKLFYSKIHYMLNENKSDWKLYQLGQVSKLNGRIGWRGLTAKEYTNEGPLFLSVHSLNYGMYVDYRDAFHISNERYEESPEIMLKKNDILICKDGAGIGKCSIVGDLPKETTINSSLLLIRCSDEINPEFLYYYLISPSFQKIVQSRLNGATTPHLYQRDITEFPVYLPSLDEQIEIVQTLNIIYSTYEKLLQNYKEKKFAFSELKQSILQKTFQGEL